jgi:hypothetical protein
MNSTEEKFISIPYSVWNNKYKPMEEELARVKEELEGRDVTIYLAVRAATSSIATAITHNKPIQIGFLTTGGFFVKDVLYKEVVDKLADEVLQDAYFSRGSGYLILGKDKAEDYIKEIDERHLMLKEIDDEVRRNKMQAEGERRLAQLTKDLTNQKINSLPRIVRYLFGIKNV